MKRAQIRVKARNAMQRVVAITESKAVIAEKCRQPRQAVDRWCRTGQVPANHCIPIEELTGGEVTRYDLRPDVFGKAPQERAA